MAWKWFVNGLLFDGSVGVGFKSGSSVKVAGVVVGGGAVVVVVVAYRDFRL